jgi:hypothetical protein
MDKSPTAEAIVIMGQWVIRNCPFCAHYHVHIKSGVQPAKCKPGLTYNVAQSRDT